MSEQKAVTNAPNERAEEMEKRIAHLNMIQGVINRMVSNSFNVKSWSVILVTGLFALSAKDTRSTLVCIAFLPAIMFWSLDGYFLWQERLYRTLFDRVRAVKDDSIDFVMDPEVNSPDAPTWLGAVLSRTLLLFHGVIVAAVIFAALLLMRHGVY
jgi:hypothetical protein